jgi:TldD protein
MRRHQLMLVAGLLFGRAFLAFSAETPEDTVLKAIDDELARSMTLRLEGLDPPYFIQYEVADSTTHRVSASYGALLRSDQTRSRTLLSQLRVGSDHCH